MRRALLVGLILALAGCQQPPLTPEDMQARKFEPVADKGVVYLVRGDPDFSSIEALIDFGDKTRVMIFPGTYYRWEVSPGTRQISGFGLDTGSIRVQVERGKIYFVQHRVSGRMDAHSTFEIVSETQGRELVMRSVLVQPRRLMIGD